MVRGETPAERVGAVAPTLLLGALDPEVEPERRGVRVQARGLRLGAGGALAAVQEPAENGAALGHGALVDRDRIEPGDDRADHGVSVHGIGRFDGLDRDVGEELGKCHGIHPYRVNRPVAARNATQRVLVQRLGQPNSLMISRPVMCFVAKRSHLLCKRLDTVP